MTRTFGLELSESVLSNYSLVFYKYQPFRILLKVIEFTEYFYNFNDFFGIIKCHE